LTSEIRPNGDGKIHVSAIKSISASGGMISWYSRPKTRARMQGTLFGTLESEGRVF